jgi:predicted nucleotidyltransferase component of viral defense system
MERKIYRDQVKLLLEILPLVALEPVFALKGGTAINLFEWDLPRLSVDIDLTYLPIEDRRTSLDAIAQALGRIKDRITASRRKTHAKVVKQGDDMEVKLLCQRGETRIKIEVNPVLRGHLLPVRTMSSSAKVEQEFDGFAAMTVLSHGELFGGKLCAALDRQHPRDLFDVRQLLDREGLCEDVRYGMIAGLVSHNRPIGELIRPRRKDQSATIKAQFEGMPFHPFTYADHEATFDQLVTIIHKNLTDADRRFLHSFEAGEPDWSLFPLAGLEALPGANWKLQNILRLRSDDPARHAHCLENLAAAFAEEL